MKIIEGSDMSGTDYIRRQFGGVVDFHIPDLDALQKEIDIWIADAKSKMKAEGVGAKVIEATDFTSISQTILEDALSHKHAHQEYNSAKQKLEAFNRLSLWKDNPIIDNLLNESGPSTRISEYRLRALWEKVLDSNSQLPKIKQKEHTLEPSVKTSG